MTPAARSTAATAAALLVACVLSAGAFLSWMPRGSSTPVSMRLPGGDGAPDRAADGEKPVEIEGVFQQFDGAPAQVSGSWPRFRGVNFDNIAADAPPLADAWGPEGPKVLWRLPMLGEGYAAPAVWEGRVYVIDYDEKTRADAIRCVSLADGREIWRRSYKVVVKKNHGMSRTVPAVDAQGLVTIGPCCHVSCLDPVTGAFRWGLDLQREYGAGEPLWYTGQCPLVEANLVILAPCGPEVLMVAVDRASGTPVWKTPNPQGLKMSHSSIIPMTVAGRRMYVYSAVGGVCGVAADGPDAGALLWQAPWAAKVVAPSAVAVDDSRVFVTAGYGEGGMMLKITNSGGAFAAEILYKHSPKDGLASEQQTPIVRDGLLFGIMPKDGGALRSQLVCYNPEGALVWSSGADNRFGLGPYLLADGKFFVLSDDGELSAVRYSTTGFEPLARAKVLNGHDAWGPMALAGGRLLVRDMTEMACVAVGKE